METRNSGSIRHPDRIGQPDSNNVRFHYLQENKILRMSVIDYLSLCMYARMCVCIYMYK